MDVAKWPGTTFAKWAALVDQTPGLDWNRKVLDLAKVTSRSSKLASSFLVSSATAKAKS
jgi:hypothetical protein